MTSSPRRSRREEAANAQPLGNLRLLHSSTTLGDECIEQLLDLIEDPTLPTPLETMDAVRRFLKALEVELGQEHPAVMQVHALILPTAEPVGRGAVPLSRQFGSRIY